MLVKKPHVAVHADDDRGGVHFFVVVPDVRIICTKHILWPAIVGLHDLFHQPSMTKPGIIAAETVVLKKDNPRCLAIHPAKKLVIGCYTVGEEKCHSEAFCTTVFALVIIPFIDLHEAIWIDIHSYK